MNSIPIQTSLILSELESTKNILDKWAERVSQGIPTVDTPGNEDAYEQFIIQLCGELMLVAGKCDTLSAILSGEGR